MDKFYERKKMKKKLSFLKVSIFFIIILNSHNVLYALPLPSQVDYEFSGNFIFDDGSETCVIPITGFATFSLLYYEEFPEYQYLKNIDWGIHLSGNDGLFTLYARLFRDEAILIPNYLSEDGWINTYDTRYEGFSETNWDSYVDNVSEDYSYYNHMYQAGGIVNYSDELWDHVDNSNFLPSSMVFGLVDENYNDSGRCEITLQTLPVPEPPTFLLFSGGLVGLAWYGRKPKKEKNLKTAQIASRFGAHHTMVSTWNR